MTSLQNLDTVGTVTASQFTLKWNGGFVYRLYGEGQQTESALINILSLFINHLIWNLIWNLMLVT